MTKKETIDSQKEDSEEIVKGDNKVDGSEVSEEKKAETLAGGEVKTKAGEKEEKSDAWETKRKKLSREKEFESKLKEQHDKYLRVSAEFDNYRKRTLKERIELTQYVSTELITRLLPVIDDFERAIETIKAAQDMDAVRQGVELICNKFKEYLSQQGVKEIDALHQEFNTDFHDAVTKFPVQENELKGKVIEVILKGYTLNDKVIRYSKVVVGE
jgi:molecular chaperone GrpE